MVLKASGKKLTEAFKTKNNHEIVHVFLFLGPKLPLLSALQTENLKKRCWVYLLKITILDLETSTPQGNDLYHGVSEFLTEGSKTSIEEHSCSLMLIESFGIKNIHQGKVFAL